MPMEPTALIWFVAVVSINRKICEEDIRWLMAADELLQSKFHTKDCFLNFYWNMLGDIS